MKRKFYLQTSTIFTYYKTGKTYKYVLWQISEEEFLYSLDNFHGYVYDENIGYIIFLKEMRIENVILSD